MRLQQLQPAASPAHLTPRCPPLSSSTTGLNSGLYSLLTPTLALAGASYLLSPGTSLAGVLGFVKGPYALFFWQLVGGGLRTILPSVTYSLKVRRAARQRPAQLLVPVLRLAVGASPAAGFPPARGGREHSSGCLQKHHKRLVKVSLVSLYALAPCRSWRMSSASTSRSIEGSSTMVCWLPPWATSQSLAPWSLRGRAEPCSPWLLAPGLPAG